MADPTADPDTEERGGDATPETPRHLAGIELDPNRVAVVRRAIEDEDAERLTTLIAPLDAADLADLLQELDRADRRVVVERIGRDLLPDVLAELDETVREEIIETLGVTETAAAVADMETDDALLVIADLDEVEQQMVLQAIPQPDRGLLEQALAYPEGSAGRLMQRELVAAPVFWTVGDAIDDIRRTAEESPDSLPYHFHDIFVVDPAHRPVGMVPLSHLIRARRAERLAAIMQTELRPIGIDTDQADVALLFRKRDLTSAPVVDEGGRLLGVITIDDVVDVIDEEHEDEMMHLGGVGTDDLYRATIDTARSRFTWLAVNLLTAILASMVIGLFDATIEHMVALAVLMPIVASMGGNAGTQTLTVAVRGLAMRELTPANALRVIGKELLVGAVNGGLFAVITGAIAWGWFGDPALAGILGLAMIVNLTVAALAGASIPIALERLGVDPAIASSVFLTTVTDVIGFFAFLGLAAWLLVAPGGSA